MWHASIDVSTLPITAPRPAPAPDPRRPSTRRSAILGVGTYVPEGVITNADLEKLVDTSDNWIVERTGIRERRRVGAGVTASMMGAKAAERAIEAAGSPRIDCLMVATVTPDTLLPTTACLLQRQLGLAGIPAFDIGAACSGYVYGLIQADALIRAGVVEHVVVVASEAMTTLSDYNDRSTCVLFGDGAAATVVGTRDHGLLASRWGADGREAELLYYGRGQQPGQDFDAVRMAGRGTFRHAVERLQGLAEGLCRDVGWGIDDVDLVIPHQANLRIIEATAKRLGLPMAKVIFNGDKLGNTSSASIPLAMAEATTQGRLHDGAKVLLLAFGAGSTWAGAAIEWGG